MSRFERLLIVGLGVLGLMGAPQARADEWNKKTTVTFNEPVEVPGRVLAAGTYVFKLMESAADRHIVQIFNSDESKLLATILAVPDHRQNPTGKTVIHFEERPKGSPEAVESWFYPGDNYGQEFVYPKARAIELAKATHHHVLSMPTPLAANITKPAKSAKEPTVVAMKKAPVKAVKPTGEEVEIAEVIIPIEESMQAAALPGSPSSAVHSATPHKMKRLPQTASSLPLVGLLGLFALGGGAMFRVFLQRRGVTG